MQETIQKKLILLAELVPYKSDLDLSRKPSSESESLDRAAPKSLQTATRTLERTLSRMSWQILASNSSTRIRLDSTHFNLRRSWLDRRTILWKVTGRLHAHHVIVETLGGTPGVNGEVWSPRSDMTLNVLSFTDNVEKFDTLVHSSTTQEMILESSCIKKVGVKSIFPELG